MNPVLRRFVLWLLSGLEESLDPDLKARLEQYRRGRKATETAIESEKIGLAKAEAVLAQIKEQRSVVSDQLLVEQDALRTLKGELKKIDEGTVKTSDPTDDDLLHRDFRSDGNRASGGR